MLKYVWKNEESGLKQCFEPESTYAKSAQLLEEDQELVPQALLDELQDNISKGCCFWIMLFEVKNFDLYNRMYGSDITTTMRKRLGRELERLARDRMQSEPTVVFSLGPNQKALILKEPESVTSGLSELCMSLRLELRGLMQSTMIKLTGQEVEIQSGCARLERKGGEDLRDSLFAALRDALAMLGGGIKSNQIHQLHEFNAILAEPRIYPVYQPIINFASGEILGWEALSRGPAGSYFHSPGVLFEFAEETGRLFDLERVCREQALCRIGELGPKQKVFINIHPKTIVAQGFSPGETKLLLDKCGIDAESVVFEITERHSLKDFTLFHRTLEHYRAQGYKVAVDDVGTGYSGMWSMAELRPDFIKVDMSLIRGIDTNPVKRALMETFVTFADKIGSQIIAEGIERETEMSCLMDMGVHCGQGYYIARPACPKKTRIENIIRPNKKKLNGMRRELCCSIPVVDLASSALCVDKDMNALGVRKSLESGEPISGVVVVEDERPVGLVMSHTLLKALSTQYGLSLYGNRKISSLMDDAPLIVEGSTPVEVVAKRAMGRDSYKAYDDIIVTEGGKLKGVVSVQKMLDTLARVQVEMAKGANPLTGLPGNVAIEQEIERRISSNAKQSIVYADLDNFKVFNDVYGFRTGDKMIMLLAKVLSSVVEDHGRKEDFVGHVGGDDFVLVADRDGVEDLCRHVVESFGEQVKDLYNDRDKKQGFISAKGRDGSSQRFPLVSVSLAVVDCVGRCNIGQISARAAEVKQYAKSLPGNVYVRDRRAPLGSEVEQPSLLAEID